MFGIPSYIHLFDNVYRTVERSRQSTDEEIGKMTGLMSETRFKDTYICNHERDFVCSVAGLLTQQASFELGSVFHLTRWMPKALI